MSVYDSSQSILSHNNAIYKDDNKFNYEEKKRKDLV